jgi:hypothetical protein
MNRSRTEAGFIYAKRDGLGDAAKRRLQKEDHESKDQAVSCEAEPNEEKLDSRDSRGVVGRWLEWPDQAQERLSVTEQGPGKAVLTLAGPGERLS